MAIEEPNMVNQSIFLRNQVVNYVLFLVGRVGSTYLTHLLNSHPNVYALQEELAALQEQGAEAQLEWTENFLTPPLIGNKSVRGFSVKKIQLVDPDKFAQLLQEKQPKIIHMQRRNRVKAVVSYLNGKRLAEKTGMWGLFDEKDRLSAFTIDPDDFDKALRNREKVEQDLADYVNTIELPKLELYYEDMLVDLKGFLNTLFTFLNVEPEQLHADVKKNTSDDLRKVIVNFDELKSSYAGTQYEEMFDEVLVP
jgi:LPS sulfotransferase NodH